MDTTQEPPIEPPLVAREPPLSQRLPMHDDQDFADVRPGCLGVLERGTVRDTEGRVVLNSASHAFSVNEVPATVNPSYSLQSTLNTMLGLAIVAA